MWRTIFSCSMLLLLAVQPVQLLVLSPTIAPHASAAGVAVSPVVRCVHLQPLHCRSSLLKMEAEDTAMGAEANTEEGAAAADGADNGEAEAAPPVKTEKEELKERIAALEADLKVARGNLIDQQEQVKDAGEAGYMLLAADFERYRLRARDELSLQEGVGKRAAVVPLLAFVEEFDRLQAAAGDEDTDGSNPIHKYYGGIYKQLNQLLDAWDLKSFDTTVGSMCEPSLHSKSKIVESEEPAGTIIEIISHGWMLGGEAVRKAECVVSGGPPQPAPEPEESSEEPAQDSEEPKEQ